MVDGQRLTNRGPPAGAPLLIRCSTTIDPGQVSLQCWTMGFGLERALVDVPCTCGYHVEVQLLDVMTQSWRWCPCCRTRLHLTEPDGSTWGAVEAGEAAIAEFSMTIDVELTL